MSHTISQRDIFHEHEVKSNGNCQPSEVLTKYQKDIYPTRSIYSEKYKTRYNVHTLLTKLRYIFATITFNVKKTTTIYFIEND